MLVANLATVELLECFKNPPSHNVPYALDWYDTSLFIDLSDSFKKTRFNRNSLANWNTCRLLDTARMFYGSGFNHPISTWDTGNILGMGEMFRESKFNHPLATWNTGNVIDMSGMFYKSLYTHPLSKWDVSAVIVMYVLFITPSYRHPLPGFRIDAVSYAREVLSLFAESPREYGNNVTE